MKEVVSLIAVSLLLAGFSQYALAQLEISAGGGGGLSILQPTTSLKGGGGLGFTGRLDGSLFWSKNIGIGLGVGLSSYKSSIKADGRRSILPNQLDVNGKAFEFQSTIVGYSEEQRAKMLNIPLMLQLRSTTAKSGGMRGAVGVKIGLLLSANYSAEAYSLINSGIYYEGKEDELDVPDNLYDKLGTFQKNSSAGSLDLKSAVSLSLEVGRQWWLTDDWSVYAGVYLDWGLNNIKRNSTVSVLAETAAQPDDSQSIIYFHQSPGKPFVEKLSPFSAGLMVKISYGRQPVTRKTTKRSKAQIAEQRHLAAERAQERKRVSSARRDSAKAIAKTSPQLSEEQRRFAADRAELAKPIDGFELNMVKLTPELQAILNHKVELLKRHPGKLVYIEGHTCDKGGFDENFDVGLHRAEAVKAYLVEHGIPAERLRPVSKGNTEPIVPNTSEANRKKNRRIEINMIDKDV